VTKIAEKPDKTRVLKFAIVGFLIGVALASIFSALALMKGPENYEINILFENNTVYPVSLNGFTGGVYDKDDRLVAEIQAQRLPAQVDPNGILKLALKTTKYVSDLSGYGSGDPFRLKYSFSAVFLGFTVGKQDVINFPLSSIGNITVVFAQQ